MKRIAPTEAGEGGKIDVASENGEVEPEAEGEGEDVEVEGDEGDDITLLSGVDDDISGDDISPVSVGDNSAI